MSETFNDPHTPDPGFNPDTGDVEANQPGDGRVIPESTPEPSDPTDGTGVEDYEERREQAETPEERSEREAEAGGGGVPAEILEQTDDAGEPDTDGDDAEI